MADPRFFTNHGPFTIGQLADAVGIELSDTQRDHSIADVAPLDRATASEISFFDNVKYIDQFTQSQAGACFIRPKYVDRAPKGMITLPADDPYRCYALIAQLFYPMISPQNPAVSDHAMVHPTATLAQGVNIEAGAVIEAHATIGENSHIGANAVIGEGVAIGSNTRISATSTISHATIGDHCFIHRGVHIGQDGFGFAMGRGGHVKMPQLGCVVIGDHVEIGAGTCIDRGTGPDTMIGQGTKIDNLVQIGHNVQIGSHCVIVSQVGISGSTRIGDGVVIGGQAGIAGHLRIGSGVKLAARSGVTTDLEAGKSYGGAPAVPIKDWHRQVIALNRLVQKPQKHTRQSTEPE